MIVEFDYLPELRKRAAGQRVVFRGGCFDVIHEGHIDALRFGKEQGDVLVVGVVSDERIRERKGPSRPVRRELSRLAVVDAIRHVDHSFIMPLGRRGLISPTMQVVAALQPDVFVEHHEAAGRWENDLDTLQAFGTEMIIDWAPKLDSTTDMIGRIAAQRAVTHEQ